MPKCPKFIVDLKQPKRSPKHGNRRTSPPAHSNPADGAGNSSRGSDAGDPLTAIWAVSWGKPSATLYPGSRIGPMTAAEVQAQRAAAMALMAQHMRAAQAAMYYLDDCVPNPKPLPHSIIQGELTGWRVWWIDTSGLFRSYTMSDRVWAPNGFMFGDVNKRNDGWGRGEGVYAFKDFGLAEIMYSVAHGFGSFYGKALGTVKLWGEVVEHRDGYRAQFAKISGIYAMKLYGTPLKDTLELYNVPIVTPPMPKPGCVVDSNSWIGRDA